MVFATVEKRMVQKEEDRELNAAKKSSAKDTRGDKRVETLMQPSSQTHLISI